MLMVSVVGAGLSDFTFELGAPADRLAGAQRDLLADGLGEMLRRANGPLDPGRGDVDRVLAQEVAKHVRDLLAERVVDALGAVDVHAEARRRHELERQHLDAGELALDSRCDLLKQLLFLFVGGGHRQISVCLEKKWARRAHFANDR